MNKLRKVGLTALAGSLVAVSANAVDLSVTGTSKLTYTSTGETAANTVSGNPWGSANSVAMTGSGDVGWATVTIKRTIGDGFFDDTAAADAFLNRCTGNKHAILNSSASTLRNCDFTLEYRYLCKVGLTMVSFFSLL